MRHVILLITALLVLPATAAAEPSPDRFWLAASGGVGSGTKRLGSMNVVAKLDGYVWLRDGFGLVATATRHHASELAGPEMATTPDGSVLAGGAAYRIDLEKVDARSLRRRTSGVPHHLHVAGLVGRDDEHGLAWMARIAMHRRHGAMLLSIDLVGYGSTGAGAAWITTAGVGFVL